MDCFRQHSPLRGVVGEVPIEIWDTSRLSIISKMDNPAGKQEQLDVAIRCDDEVEAYGFNNESYRHNWRHPGWKMAKGRHLLEAIVRSAGQKVSERFLLNNDLDGQFRLAHGRDPELAEKILLAEDRVPTEEPIRTRTTASFRAACKKRSRASTRKRLIPRRVWNQSTEWDMSQRPV